LLRGGHSSRERRLFVERGCLSREAVCRERLFVEGGGCSLRERGDRSSNAGGGCSSGGGHLLREAIHRGRLLRGGCSSREGGDRLLRGHLSREEAVERRPFVERGGRSLREEAIYRGREKDIH